MPNRPMTDRTNVRYGHLVAIRAVGSNDYGQALWECRCDCGSVTVKSVVFLNNGGKCCSRSCTYQRKFKHQATLNRTKSKEYTAWTSMKQRCLNPNALNYKDYGGRGITICQQWVDSFEQFLADVGKAPEGNRISIDRINNEGNYEPNNVRWATPREQVMNRRNSKQC